jgi:GntR family transcriptional regulator
MHEQLADRLRHVVAQLEPDSRMPTEMELVTSYGVSRTTVRRAVAALVDEGLLVRRQGAGTFVPPKRVVHPLDQLRPFVSMFSNVGKYPEGRIVRFEWTENPAGLKDLGINSGLLVRRIYLIDGRAQAMVDITLPAAIGEQISRAQIEEHPIYQVLQQNLGLSLSYGDIALASVGASAEQAEALGIAVGSPLLMLLRTTYDKEGIVVEHAIYHMLASQFELRLTVDAKGFEDLSYSFSRPGPELVMRTDSDAR